MGKISIPDLEKSIHSLLVKTGMNMEHVGMVTDVYMRATLRSAGHHDIHDLFSRINDLQKNNINNHPNIIKTTGFGAIECFDGDNGLGEICTYFVTEKSMELAERHGIGFCAIRNSNHFLSAAPFVEMADGKGFLTLVFSKSPGGMSLPDANVNIIGNNPFGYAAGFEEGRILFDICLAYSSYGKMGEKVKNNEEVPVYWGLDSEGIPTSDPGKILESGLFMPIGGHKGFGLAILVEILTTVISNGVILNQREEETGLKGKYSQTAISIDIKKIMGLGEYEQRNQEMVNIFRQLHPDIVIPGQRTEQAREKIMQLGYFELEEDVLKKLVE